VNDSGVPLGATQNGTLNGTNDNIVANASGMQFKSLIVYTSFRCHENLWLTVVAHKLLAPSTDMNYSANLQAVLGVWLQVMNHVRHLCLIRRDIRCKENGLILGWIFELIVENFVSSGSATTLG
jgi:hypothetical protein